MANLIKIKRSAVARKIPLTSDLDLGELAINTNDGKLYLKQDNGTPSIILLNGINYTYVTGNYTASIRESVFVNVTDGPIVLTLPASPVVGDFVSMVDYAGTISSTNTVTIDRNGSTIEGAASNIVLSYPKNEVQFLYTGTTWAIFSTPTYRGVTSSVYLSGPASADEGTIARVRIGDYSPSVTYTVTVSGGSYVRTADTIDWTLPSVGSDTEHYVSLIVSGVGSYSHYIEVLDVATVTDTGITITNFSVNTGNDGWSV